MLGILKHLRSVCVREQFDEDPSIVLPNLKDALVLPASLCLLLRRTLVPTIEADQEMIAGSSLRGGTFAVLSLDKTYFLKSESYLRVNSNGFHYTIEHSFQNVSEKARCYN